MTDDDIKDMLEMSENRVIYQRVLKRKPLERERECPFVFLCSLRSKVENILKGSLDSIPSPSPLVNMQNIGGKVYLR